MSRLRQDCTPLPLRGISSQRKSGPGRLLRLRMEGPQDRLRLVQARRSPAGATGRRQATKQQVQATAPQRGTGNNRGSAEHPRPVNRKHHTAFSAGIGRAAVVQAKNACTTPPCRSTGSEGPRQPTRTHPPHGPRRRRQTATAPRTAPPPADAKTAAAVLCEGDVHFTLRNNVDFPFPQNNLFPRKHDDDIENTEQLREGSSLDSLTSCSQKK